MRKKTSNKHGGKRKGAGRKAGPNPRNSTYSIAVSAADKQLLMDTGAGDWAYRTLMSAARRRQARGK